MLTKKDVYDLSIRIKEIKRNLKILSSQNSIENKKRMSLLSELIQIKDSLNDAKKEIRLSKFRIIQ